MPVTQLTTCPYCKRHIILDVPYWEKVTEKPLLLNKKCICGAVFKYIVYAMVQIQEIREKES